MGRRACHSTARDDGLLAGITRVLAGAVPFCAQMCISGLHSECSSELIVTSISSSRSFLWNDKGVPHRLQKRLFAFAACRATWAGRIEPG